MVKNDSGYIVVETIGAFLPFVLLMASILSLVNIVAVQARVHYALAQAANTLSVYSYTFEILGVANDLTALDNKADRVAREVAAMKNDMSAVLTGINSLSGLSGAATGGTNAVNRALSWGEEAVGDPEATLQLLASYGVNELRSYAFGELVRPLVGRYLTNGDMTGDEYLRRFGVVKTANGSIESTGLEALEFYSVGNAGLGNSVMIDRNGDVRLVVEYEIEYTFGGLPLPFRPTLKVTQTVVTKAWLNGSGKGYW